MGNIAQWGKPYLRRLAGHQLEDPRGEAGGVRALGELHGAERSGAGGFERHRTSGRQGGRDFADRQHEREVPGADRGDQADGGLHRQVSFALHLGWNDAAVPAARFLGKPAEMVQSHRHLGLALRERLSVFERDGPRHLLAPFAERAGHLGEIVPPGAPGDAAPSQKRLVSAVQCTVDDLRVHGGHAGEGLAGGGIAHREGRRGGHERAVEVNRVALHFAASTIWSIVFS